MSQIPRRRFFWPLIGLAALLEVAAAASLAIAAFSKPPALGAAGLNEHDLVYVFLDAIYLKLRTDDTPARTGSTSAAT